MKRILRVVTLVVLLLTGALWNEVSAAITTVTAVTNNICNGVNHGSINILPAGGTVPYTYVWSNGATTQNATNLIAGTYTVTITDNVGTTAGFTYTVTQPAALIITKSVTNETCGGQNIGTITLNITNPSSVYTFHWNNGATTENLVNLTAAEYYVTITDALGCTTIDSADVIQPPGVGITDTITGVTCSAGMNNGAIAVGVQYGNSPYTFAWNDGPTTESRTNLTTGTYVLTVTDALGCTATASATVNQLPGSMSVNTSGTNPSCHGGNNGSATVTSVVGSTGPYTYLWTGGSTTQTITSLAAGTYTVTATSSTGCSASANVTLTQPASMTATVHTFPPTCYGGNNGAITSSAANGSSPYSYAWTGGYTTANITSLTANTYILTVTDHGGCKLLDTVPLSQPTQVIVTATPTPLTCTGGATGTITTSVTGGTSPYSYLWALGGGVSPNRTHLSAGTYTVTVTDATGCSATGSATISPYTPMSFTSAVTPVVCYGSANGAINLTVNNGTAPYSYIWNNGNNTNNPDTLIAGNYTATVTDNKGCTATTTVSVTGPAFAIIVNDTISDVSCFGLSDASISLYPVYGTPPYVYKWSGVGTNNPTRTSLSAGTYTCSISDNNGCTVIGNYTVTQPALITPTTAVTNVSCFGGNNGAINLSVTGGYSPFSYVWSDGPHTQTRSSLHNGSYGVTITDNHGCTMTASASVGQPTQLTVSATGVNPACSGGNNGTINTTASGGTLPYSFNWGSGILTQNRTGLTAGTYTVTVTDSAGCTASTSQTLTAPTALSISATGSNISCGGGNTGTITTNTSGGTTPYTYDWGSGINTPNRTNLAAGTYTVTVTDHNLCTATNSASVTQTSGLSASATATNVSCNGGNNGTITTNVTGGTTPYSYDWGNSITSSQRNNLTSGTYTVTISDHGGCSSIITTAITQPALLTVSATSTPATCFGGNTGAIHITPAGGTGTYTFNWGGNITTQNRSNLAAGSYTVTVTDSASCTVASTTAVTQPTQLTATATLTNVSCNGGSDGAIQITPAGGTSGYTINWGGGITGNRTGLAQGSYTATVTDANGCSITNTSGITQPAVITASTTTTNVTCFGQANGTITLTVGGGTGPYTYNWGSVNTQNRTGLAAGNYTVTITDAHGCTATASASITQPQQVTATVSVTSTPSCFGSNNGSVNSSTTGGISPFTYVWSNGATTQNITNIPAATYSVSVTDAHGCTASSTLVSVTQPTQITISTSPTNILCNGGATGTISTTVNGGNGGYTYLWSNNATTANISQLTAASYSVVCRDASSCSVSASAQVTEPTAISLTSTQTNVTCNGGNTGTATVNPTGGTGAYNYLWTGGQTTAQITQLAQGTYNVTVHDANSCASTLAVTISQINSIVLNATPTNAVCPGQANGSVQTTVSGGAGGYSYIWTNGATVSNITGLAAGTYTVTVTDANNCNSITSATVTQPNAITLTQTVTNATCFGLATGGIQLSDNGGTGSYQYRWSNGATTQNLSNVAAGNYSVTVTDANGCSAHAGRSVSQPTQLDVSLNGNDVSCFGGTNGSATSTVTGGNTPYTYFWSNNSTTVNVGNVQPATYTLTVRDAMNCTASNSVTIGQPTAINIIPTITGVACNNNNGGEISVQVTGGAGGYTYNWSNHATTPQIDNLNAGTYNLTVQDANSCIMQASLSVSQPQPVSLTTSVTSVACAGINSGTASVHVTGGTPPFLYNWSNLLKTATIDSIPAGSYSITVTDNNGCTANKTVTVTSAPPLAVVPAVLNATCPSVNNGSISLSVTGGTSPYNYNWNNGASGSTANALAGGSYNVTITDAQGCIIQSGGIVANGYELTVQASSSADTAGNSVVQLDATTNTDHGNVYNWTPANVVTCSTCQNTSSKPTETTTYTVYVVDSNGCKAESAVTVTVNTPPVTTTPITTTTLFIPNAFTPNGDGQNDEFKIFGSNLGDVNFIDIAVFDRWGEKVFESNDPNFAWDGIYKGQPAPQGVYVYVATAVFNTGDHKDYKGSVTLIR